MSHSYVEFLLDKNQIHGTVFSVGFLAEMHIYECMASYSIQLLQGYASFLEILKFVKGTLYRLIIVMKYTALV